MISEIEDSIDMPTFNVVHHNLKRVEVSMDVGDDGYSLHNDKKADGNVSFPI